MRRKLINTCTCQCFIIFLMTQASLYDVLLVDQHATLEEIKLAFKKRALQVHPDKGGSKEAFHLVYEALETLADPEARQKYDSGMANISTTVQHPEDTGPRRKKTSMKHPTAQKEPRPEKAQKSNKRTADGSNAERKPAEPKATQPEQTKLLIRIRDILKKLPRDVRSDVITKQFSQKQRLILEKWMVDMSSAQGGREGPLEIAVEGQVAAVQTLHSTTSTTLPNSPCSALALPTSSASFSPKESKKQSAKQTTRNPKKEPTKTGSVGGYLMKSGGSSSRYIAVICFDAVEIHTRACDFQTGLEYLVVLTAVKQKMRDPHTMHVCFEQRLQKALVSSAKEHRGDSEELKLDFCVVLSARFFIGAGLRTPKVHTVEQLGKTRRLLEPFRKYQYAKGGGRRNYFWHYSPVHLQDAWERFKKAVAELLRHGILQGETAAVFCRWCIPVIRLKLNTWMQSCNSGNRLTWQCKTRKNISAGECEKGIGMGLPSCIGSGDGWPWKTRTNTGPGNSEFVWTCKSVLLRNFPGHCQSWKGFLLDGNASSKGRHDYWSRSGRKPCNRGRRNGRRTKSNEDGRKPWPGSVCEKRNAWDKICFGREWDPTSLWTRFLVDAMLDVGKRWKKDLAGFHCMELRKKFFFTAWDEPGSVWINLKIQAHWKLRQCF